MAVTISAGADLAVGDDGGLVLTRGADAVRQEVVQRLRLLLGEWLLDTDQGVPYRSQVFRRHDDAAVAAQIVVSEVESLPDVRSAEVRDVKFDSAARHLSFTVDIVTTEGEVINGIAN